AGKVAAASTVPFNLPKARSSCGWCARTLTGSMRRACPVALPMPRRTNQYIRRVNQPAPAGSTPFMKVMASSFRVRFSWQYWIQPISCPSLWFLHRIACERTDFHSATQRNVRTALRKFGRNLDGLDLDDREAADDLLGFHERPVRDNLGADNP